MLLGNTTAQTAQIVLVVLMGLLGLVVLQQFLVWLTAILSRVSLQTVLGEDFAAAALAVAGRAAEEAAVADRVDWLRRDLERQFPAGSWELVVASYLHSPVAFARDQVLRQAAAAVAPGGSLLVLGHAGLPGLAPEPGDDADHRGRACRPRTDGLGAGAVRRGSALRWPHRTANRASVPTT